MATTTTIIDDSEVEGDETVVMSILPDAVYTICAASSDAVTISSDDLALAYADDLALCEGTRSGSVASGDLSCTHASDNSAEVLSLA